MANCVEVGSEEKRVLVNMKAAAIKKAVVPDHARYKA